MAFKKILYQCLSVALILLTAFCAFGLDVPDLKGRVNDYGNILSDSTERQIDAVLGELERTDSTQIAVLTVPSLGGEDIEGFSLRVAEKWGIGQKEEDNGAILVISKNDRKLRIEVGYGLEGSLTDLTSGRIIRNIIVPYFKRGDFDAGVSSGVHAMIQAVRGEFEANSKPERVSSKRSSPGFYGFFLILFIVNILGRVKRPLGAVAGGILLPIVGVLLFSPGLLIFLLMIPIGIAGGLFLSLFGGPLSFGSTYGSRRRGGGYWMSGGGGFGGSGGGFGGFSGGGGGFGGGGASGGW